MKRVWPITEDCVSFSCCLGLTKQAHTVLYLWSQDQDNSRLWSSLTEWRRSTILEPQTKISWHSVIFCLGRPKIPQCVCSLFYRTIAVKPLYKKRPKHNQTWSKQTHQSTIWQNTNTRSVLLKYSLLLSLGSIWIHTDHRHIGSHEGTIGTESDLVFGWDVSTCSGEWAVSSSHDAQTWRAIEMLPTCPPPLFPPLLLHFYSSILDSPSPHLPLMPPTIQGHLYACMYSWAGNKFKYVFYSHSHWYTVRRERQRQEKKKGRHSLHSVWTQAKSYSEASYTSTLLVLTFIIYYFIHLMMFV